jgi:hypothetical protein
MPKIGDVCHVRSKNAGPYWITLDFFFPDRETYDRHVRQPQLGASAIGALFDADAALIKRFEVADLLVLKVSFPRGHPQGGRLERDMHGGQQYVRLLDVQL